MHHKHIAFDLRLLLKIPFDISSVTHHDDGTFDAGPDLLSRHLAHSELSILAPEGISACSTAGGSGATGAAGATGATGTGATGATGAAGDTGAGGMTGTGGTPGGTGPTGCSSGGG